MKRFLAAVLAWLALGAAGQADPASDWPTHQVTIVIPFAAGGTTDLFGRILADKLQAKYGKPFVVENRPGAGGNIGAGYVARAAPDGYTLVVGTVGTHAINPSLYKHLPFDPEKDFEPINGIATLPNLLVVNPKLPVKTVPELIAYLKQNPGKLNYGSSGAGTSQHLTAALFALKTGTTMTHIPFRGSSEIMNNLIGDHIDLAFDNMTTAWPQAQGGTIRPVAVTSLARNPAAPDVPTVADTLPGFDATSWNGLWAPKGTPRAITDKIAADVKVIMEDPAIVKKSFDLAATPFPSSPDAFAAFVRGERQKWEQVVKAVGVQVGR